MGSSYGIGQGIADGVKMLMPMMQMHQQNQRFDKQMGQQSQQFYDQLAVRSGWQDGRMGQVGMAQEPANDSAGVDQTSQVGRLEVPGRPVALPNPGPVPQGMPPGMALGLQGNQTPRMPNPVAMRGGRRLY